MRSIARREVGGECLGGCPVGICERQCHFHCRSDVLKFSHVKAISASIFARFLGLSRSYSGHPHLQRVRSHSEGGGVHWTTLAIIVTLDKSEPG